MRPMPAAPSAGAPRIYRRQGLQLAGLAAARLPHRPWNTQRGTGPKACDCGGTGRCRFGGSDCHHRMRVARSGPGAPAHRGLARTGQQACALWTSVQPFGHGPWCAANLKMCCREVREEPFSTRTRPAAKSRLPSPEPFKPHAPPGPRLRQPRRRGGGAASAAPASERSIWLKLRTANSSSERRGPARSRSKGPPSNPPQGPG